MSQREIHPKFAVVGHPNKGKSSIVSALAMDDTVAISDVPGTTTKSRSFPLKVDGKVLYELFDTPGFQRARQVLAWLKKHDVSADKRHEVVRAFIDVHRDDPRFNDEVELLEPIMQGAGIIYVVDASKPYGEEYEAEMEILRWTGQPSMALINHIDVHDYSDAWKRALSGYFHIIRTFNPMKHDRHTHRAILESMAQLKEEWTAQVKASIALFESYYEMLQQRSAQTIAQLMIDSLSFVASKPLKDQEDEAVQKRRLEEVYKESLRHFEHTAQRKIDAIWNHRHLEKSQEEITFDQIDLFSEESASLFGLTRKELMVTAVTTGAATGAGVDLLFAGHTMLLGGAVGALVGGVGAWLSFDRLSEIKILGKKVGVRTLEMGPMKNPNFPYIQLGRILYYTATIANLSHAMRKPIALKMDRAFKDQWLDDTTRKALEKFHKRSREGKVLSEEMRKSYEALILERLKVLVG